MNDAQQILNELCEEVTELGHRLALIVEVVTTDEQLSRRAKAGLTEYGINSVERFAEVEAKLIDYKNTCAPSCSKSSRC